MQVELRYWLGAKSSLGWVNDFKPYGPYGMDDNLWFMSDWNSRVPK